MSSSIEQAEQDLHKAIGPISEVLSSHIFTSTKTDWVHGHAFVALWSKAHVSVIEVQSWNLNPYNDDGWTKDQSMFINSFELEELGKWAARKSPVFAPTPPIDNG